MPTPLVIVARIEAKPEHREAVQAELLKLIAPTRLEAGCLQYDLHQDHENPSLFLFYELWENRELWQVHMQTAHLQAYAKATENKVAHALIHEMSVIG